MYKNDGAFNISSTTDFTILKNHDIIDEMKKLNNILLQNDNIDLIFHSFKSKVSSQDIFEQYNTQSIGKAKESKCVLSSRRAYEEFVGVIKRIADQSF